MRGALLALALVGSILASAPSSATAEQPETVGLVDTTTGYWYLRDANGATTAFYFGNPGDVPFMGDWDCDGIDTPGLYRRADGYVYLRNSNMQGTADVSFFFGDPGDVPVAGDFDGDGCDTVSVFRPAGTTVYVVNELGANGGGLGAAEYSYSLGDATDAPVGGDFDADGVDEIGLYDSGSATLIYLAHAGGTPSTVIFGNPGDRLLAGDWGAGHTLGVYRPIESAFHLQGLPIPLRYGNAALTAVAGSFGALPGGGTPPPDLPAVAVERGSTAPLVGVLQQMLADRAFYRGPINGSYDSATSQAVMAFHKDQGLARSWDWAGEDWLRLAAYQGPTIPQRPDEPNRVEIDLGKQVGYLIEGGVVTAIVPVSSGNGALFEGRGGSLARAYTPRGDFTFDRHIAGLRVSYLGVLYKPWYFKGGYAWHGSPSVPGYPASHGCIRMPNWDADWLDGHLYLGMPVHVYG